MNQNTNTGDPIAGAVHTTPPITPREAIISTAVTFLQNGNVKRSPLNQKQHFLRSKGLSEDEIQIACERAGVFTIDPNSTAISIETIGNIASHSHAKLPVKISFFQKAKNIAGTTAFVAGITYAVYLFYKKYIEPLLFDKKKKKKSVEDTLNELKTDVTKNLTDIAKEIEKVRDDVSYKQRNETVLKELTNFKSDLDAIKGLLLNRKQFVSPIVPPSIPAWQLQSRHTQQVVDEADKNDDSGSGSSETEVVTKNSDSSLELIS